MDHGFPQDADLGNVRWENYVYIRSTVSRVLSHNGSQNLQES